MDRCSLAWEVGKPRVRDAAIWVVEWNVEAGRIKLTARDTIEAQAEALGVHPDEVYRVIGTVPHDITEQLQATDLETWQAVRTLIGNPSEEASGDC